MPAAAHIQAPLPAAGAGCEVLFILLLLLLLLLLSLLTVSGLWEQQTGEGPSSSSLSGSEANSAEPFTSTG